MRVLWGPGPTLHIFIIIGDQVPEADIGTPDGADRHPFAVAEVGVSEAVGYEQGRAIC